VKCPKCGNPVCVEQPETAPASSQSAPPSGNATATSSRMADEPSPRRTFLVRLGTMAANGVRMICVETCRQMVRWARRARAPIHRRSLLGRLRETKVSLGEVAFAARLGDEALLQQLEAIDQRLSTAKATGGRVQSLEIERKRLLIQLASEIAEGKAVCESVADRVASVRDLEAQTADHDARNQSPSFALWPPDRRAGRRTAIGLGGLVAVLLVFMLFLAGGSPSTQSGTGDGRTSEQGSVSSRRWQDAVVDIRPARNADERLALAFMFQYLCASIPNPKASTPATEKALLAIRVDIEKQRAHAELRNYEDIVKLYDNLSSALGNYESFLQRVGKVRRQASGAFETAQVQTGVDSGLKGGMVGWQIREGGGSGSDAVIGGLLVAGLNMLIQDAVKTKQINEWEQQQFSRAASDVQRRQLRLQEQRKALLASIAEKHGWDDSRFDRATCAVTPPIMWCGEELSNLFQSEGVSIQEQLAGWKQVLEIVPGNPVFDKIRDEVMCYGGGGALLIDARKRGVLDSSLGSVSQGNRDFARLAVKWLNTAIELSPDTERRKLYRPYRALGLALGGDIGEACKQARAVQDTFNSTVKGLERNRGYWEYTYARLMSVGGDHRAAIQWLGKAAATTRMRSLFFTPQSSSEQSGFRWLVKAETDPDFATLRETSRAQLQRMRTVRFEWDIDYGTFNDDIILVNKSRFAITKCIFRPVIVSSGRKWTPVLKGDLLKPNYRWTWKDCVSIPGSRHDSATATLACDQNR